MPRPQMRLDVSRVGIADPAPAKPARSVRIADEASVAVFSPALALQADLAASFRERAVDDVRWSARRSLAFVTVASVGGWALLIAGVRALVSLA